MNKANKNLIFVVVIMMSFARPVHAINIDLTSVQACGDVIARNFNQLAYHFNQLDCGKAALAAAGLGWLFYGFYNASKNCRTNSQASVGVVNLWDRFFGTTFKLGTVACGVASVACGLKASGLLKNIQLITRQAAAI